MMTVRRVRGMLAAGALAAWVVGAGAQSSAPANPAPCTVAPQPVPCGASAPAGSAAPGTNGDKFPFPGEVTGGGSSSPARPAAAAPKGDVPAAPGTGAGGQKTSGGDFPFPGEAYPEGAAGSSGSNRSGSSSSSSSSSSGADAPDATDPDASALKDKGSGGAPQGRHLLHRVNPKGTKLQTDDEREAEDLDVARYYVQTGDTKAAYMRAQDAVKTAPDDPEAHLLLAQMAVKLNKPDEAITEFQACLKNDPDEKQTKAARKELAKLKP